MKRLLPILILLMPCASAWGRWGIISLEDLVAHSDFIVVSTLTNVVQFSDLTQDHGRGIITVEEVLWGRMEPGQRVVLAWENWSTTVCPRVEHSSHQGLRGIWLLKFAPTGHVRADYPWRFVDLSEKEQVERLLAAHSPAAVVQYTQVASVESLLRSGRPYAHYAGTVLVAAGLLGASAWLLRALRRRSSDPRYFFTCPYCHSPVRAKWWADFQTRQRCGACARQSSVRVPFLRYTACVCAAVVFAGLAGGYIGLFWTGGVGALIGYALAGILWGISVSLYVHQSHGRLQARTDA